MIAAIPVLGYVAELGSAHGRSDWTVAHGLVASMAVWTTWVGIRFRSRYMRRSRETQAKDPSSRNALRQWEVAHIIALTMAESVAMWGLVVRMVLNGGLWQASLFYGSGLFLLLLWTPRFSGAPAFD